MIERYEFGRIVVDGKGYSADLIIFPDRVMSDWWREEGHELRPVDLWEVVRARPKVLVVGTGHSGMMRVPPETERYIREQGIQLIVEPTAQACRTYNRLRERGEDVVAALHLTC